VWEAVEAVMSRAELRAAVKTAHEMVPPPDAEAETDGWRAELTGRISTASGFVKLLTSVIAFDANAEGEQVLKAMQRWDRNTAERGRERILRERTCWSGPYPCRAYGVSDRSAS